MFILSAFPAWSQTGEWKDEYSRFTDLTPWVRSSNPAGIATLPVDKTSTVRASLEKKNGGLMDLHESRDCFRPSLDAASYMRISDRITFYGRMNYSYFKGKDMGGQILMDPYYNPINFLESVDTTTGTKTLEEYTLEGAMAYSLNDRLTLAGKVSYQSADYAKRKDPRSYNQWMDLDASVGARYSLADGKTAFGVSLNYVKTVETWRRSFSARLTDSTTALSITAAVSARSRLSTATTAIFQSPTSVRCSTSSSVEARRPDSRSVEWTLFWILGLPTEKAISARRPAARYGSVISTG